MIDGLTSHELGFGHYFGDSCQLCRKFHKRRPGGGVGEGTEYCTRPGHRCPNYDVYIDQDIEKFVAEFKKKLKIIEAENILLRSKLKAFHDSPKQDIINHD